MPRRPTLDHKLLDPKLDVVFKLLFTDPANRELLSQFLTDFLQPQTPIIDIVVLNPELPKTRPGERGAEVDLLVRFDGGQRAHVEIQVARHEGFIGRSLFYWARTFSQQLARGDEYSQLAATSGIFILDYRLLPDPDYHHNFALFERTRQRELTDLLALHYLELPKIPSDLEAALRAVADPSPVLRWTAFLAAKSDQQLERLAMTDPTLKKAVDALEQLSENPYAQDAAFLRSLEEASYEGELRRRYERGVEMGIEKGLEQGIQQARASSLAAIRSVCASFDIALDEQRQRALDRAGPEALAELLHTLAITRAWPKSENWAAGR